MEWVEMTEEQQFWTLRTMEFYGGGFTRKLADAWLLADSDNAKRLRDAFPEMARKYGPGTDFYRYTHSGVADELLPE